MADPAKRSFPMNKPAGHKPAIQRYASRVADHVESIRVLVFGQQMRPGGETAHNAFLKTFEELRACAGEPLLHDLAALTDPSGYDTILAVCYWHDETAYSRWQASFDSWFASQDPAELNVGYFVESFAVPASHRETIAFHDYLRGLSACPDSRIEPVEESGYWGAARDRFAASAREDFATPFDSPLVVHDNVTMGRRITIKDIPQNLCVIQSGVSWEHCGAEQMASFETNLKPKLDAGMEYLRQNPVETGCFSLRQVGCLDATGRSLKEAYSLGVFLSMAHLERWAEHHPTHLAIFKQALEERKKYQERLELKTYHEVYVLNRDVRVEYLNCHNHTGLLPFFNNQIVTE